MDSKTEQLIALLESSNLEIQAYTPGARNEIRLAGQKAISIQTFCDRLISSIGDDISKYQDLWPALRDASKMRRILDENHKKEIPAVAKTELPEEYKGLQLFVDPKSPNRELVYYLATGENKYTDINAHYFMKKTGLKEDQATPAVRDYRPRDPAGTFTARDEAGVTNTYFNTYIKPEWMEYEGDLPDELPSLFLNLVEHLIPKEEEREYLYAWLYRSLTHRSFVYLILCGAPGAGKNRLKLVMRALHGHSNTVDGKKTTITSQFNSQLFGNTLTWFDELHYNQDMEDRMKEMQNDSIAEERKGIDATRSTPLYASFVISNNKPRNNFIAFDARKFAPLSVAQLDLKNSMMNTDIDALTVKVENPTKPGYDIAFIAQIGRWILKHGDSGVWPNLEYKGRMFWSLAHVSMTKWQKSIMTHLESPTGFAPVGKFAVEFDEVKGYKWSTVFALWKKKEKSSSFDNSFPEYSSVRHFFKTFRDSDGNKIFETTGVVGSIVSDFWFKKVVKDVRILTEDDILREIDALSGKVNNGKEESTDDFNEDDFF